MNPDQVLDLTRQSIRMMVMLSAPILLCALVVGVLVNVFQAVTQLSEATIAFIPKLAAMIVAFLLFAPWMVDMISEFTIQLFQSIPMAIR